MACGGGGTAVLSSTHGRASPSAPDLRFSFVPFRFSTRFSGLCCKFAFKIGCIWLQKGTTSIIPPFLHHLVLVFRIDYGERGRGEDCKDSMLGLRSKDSSMILAEHFFSFSSLFSL